jgi:hypothetical protein
MLDHNFVYDRNCSFLLLKLYLTLCRIWGSHSGNYEEFHFLGYNAVKSVKVNRRFGGTCFTLVFCLAHSSTLKMERHVPPKRHFTFQRTTRRYIPEDRTLVPHIVLVRKNVIARK